MVAASPTKKVPKTRATKVPSRYEALLNGTMSVEDLDVEEIQKGQLRDANGTFTGRPPNVIPRNMHIKLVQELMKRMDASWREHATEALGVFIEIMNNPKVRPQDRLYAAQYVVERIQGKIPEKQEISATVSRWETVAERVIVEVSGSEDIEDAEIVDDQVDSGRPALPAATSERRTPRRPTRKAG